MFGEEHPFIATTLNNLAGLYQNKGEYEKAESLYNRALEIIRNSLGEEHPHIAVTLNNLAGLYKNLKRYDEALLYYTEVFNINKRILKPKDPELGLILNNLGLLLLDMDLFEEAKQMFEKALEIYTEPTKQQIIGKKAESIIRLITLNSKQAERETNPFNQMKYLREAFNLCKKIGIFFLKYELKQERKLVTEMGLSAYIDFLMINIRFEVNSNKRAREYEQALQTVEKLGENESDEQILKVYSSAVCYLRGRKLVNEALSSKQPELELLRQAVEQFWSAKEAYEKANVCFCTYQGLLKILEAVDNFEEVDISELNKLIQEIVEVLPDDISPSIRVYFESIQQLFEEKSKISRKELMKQLDQRIDQIEYKALEKLFGHVHEKIKNYFDEPFNPNLIYENWKLIVIFDDSEKVKGKLTIKAGNKTLLNRPLTPEEIKNNLLEIDYLTICYFPQGQDEISFITPGQKKPIIRSIDYFENVGRDNRIKILQYDCSTYISINNYLRVAAVQLKYHIYEENSVVRIKADHNYLNKIMKTLDVLKDEADIVVFPEFSIPFDALRRMHEFATESGIIIIAGSHYVKEVHIREYGELFSRDFDERDLRKNILPVLIPFSKIVHNEKLLDAREGRNLYFDEGIKAGNVNHILKLRDGISIGIMIGNEYLNSDLRNRLISACDIILVPQTNQNLGRFYQIAKADINNPLCFGNKTYIMANGIFTFEENNKIHGGFTGIISTVDKYLYRRHEEGILSPVDGVMEQFILLTSINMDVNPVRGNYIGQVPLKTKIIHVFEEDEILRNSESEGRKFIQLLDTIGCCVSKEELKELLTSEKNKALINTFSPLMYKNIQDLNNLYFEEMKNKCRYIMTRSVK